MASSSIRPYGVRDPLLPSAKIGATQPAQRLTTFSVSASFLMACPPPAASSGVCAAKTEAVITRIDTAVKLRNARLPTFVFILPLLFIDGVSTPRPEGPQTKKTPFRSASWTKRTSLSFAHMPNHLGECRRRCPHPRLCGATYKSLRNCCQAPRTSSRIFPALHVPLRILWYTRTPL